MGRGVKRGVNDIRTCRPDIAECMDRFNDLLGIVPNNIPECISVSGKAEVWCMCDKTHVFHRIANKMNHLQRDKDGCIICPVCNGSEIQKGVNSLGDLRKDMLAEWYWEKNNELGIDPYTISPYYNKKVWWKCKKGHHWFTSPHARINQKDKSKIYGCRFCDKQEMWPGDTDALTVLTKLNRQDVIEEFYLADNNGLRLENLFYHSTKQYNFKCPKCNTVRKKTFVNAVDYGCSGCTNQTVTEFNSLKARYPLVAAKYDKSGVNEIPSHKIIMGGNEKYGFYCDVCNQVYYDTIPHQVNGRGCTECYKAHRTSWPEQMFYYGLKSNLPNLTIENRHLIDGCVFDIYIPELRTIIEYDGEYYHSLPRHKLKELEYNRVAREHKLKMYRYKEISETDLELLNRLYYHPFVDNGACCVYIPITNKDENKIEKLCKHFCGLLNRFENISCDFDISKIPIEEVNKNTLYDRGKDSLIVKYPEVVEKYWDYERNEKLNITPYLVTPKSHHQVYMRWSKEESVLVRVDNFMRNFDK